MNNWWTWSLLSAFFAGLTAILAKIGIQGVDSNLATAIRTSVILIFTWSLVWFTRTYEQLGSLPQRAWLFLVLSGLATGASWICYFQALQLGDASQVAPVDKLSVVFAIVFAVVILRERLTWHLWAGGALIIAGALILAWKT